METNPKIRGIQHLKNKSKYKGKSKTLLKTTSLQQQPRRIHLNSNWTRYEDDLTTDNEQYESLATDYTVLANAPISKGSHFQFRSDVDNEQSIEENQFNTNDLFNLDLNLLGLSLETIPFNERCNIPENYFTETQLNYMKSTAKTNENELEKILLKEKIDEIIIGNSGDSQFDVEEKFSDSQNKNSKKDNSDVQIEQLSELEEELSKTSLTQKTQKNISRLNVSSSGASTFLEKESLEEWLDDVLND